MIFHEIYGCYYNTVAKILSLAVQGELTEQKMNQIARDEAFSESFLSILPALKEQKWQLIYKDLHTPLSHTPTMPLTTLQKRWLKAISLDPRIKLFSVDTAGLEDVQPLFTADDYVIFDKYNDGDPYEEPTYIKNFQTILRAIKTRKKLHVHFTNGSGRARTSVCDPRKLEYSEKDDKFRLLVTGCRNASTINISRILECEILEDKQSRSFVPKAALKDSIVIKLLDERNALERVMLHFSHFEKQAEKIDDKHYKVTVFYDSGDETEVLIRVLSFGPMIKVTQPESFVELIKERLIMQQKCELK